MLFAILNMKFELEMWFTPHVSFSLLNRKYNMWIRFEIPIIEFITKSEIYYEKTLLLMATYHVMLSVESVPVCGMQPGYR